jgi:signal transduction histidine kinase
MSNAQHIDELEQRLLQIEQSEKRDPITHIDTLVELSWLQRVDDMERAHELARQARTLAIEHDYPLAQARAARTMAMTIGDINTLRSVFDLAQEAKELFDQVGDRAGMAGSRDFLSSIHEHIGDLAIALEYAMEALQIARQLENPVRVGYALSSVGGVLAASGDADAGIARLEEALAIFEEADDAQGVGTIRMRLAKVMFEAGRVEDARRYAELSLKGARDQQNDFVYVAALKVLADLEQQAGNLDAAEAHHRQALECRFMTQTSLAIAASSNQVALGRLLFERGALDEAEDVLKDALSRIAGDTVSIVNEAATHEALAELYQATGNLPAALEHLRNAKEQKVRIAQQETRNKLAQVEARAAVEAARKDAEIHKLRFVELHAMQSKVVESEKMALLGRLAAGMAHELNTPLGVLKNNSELITRAVNRLIALLSGELPKKGEKLVALLESCSESNVQALSRLSEIGESFERFTHLDHAEKGAFDVRHGLQSALLLLEPTLPEGISFERHFNPVPLIDAWPRELNHAFMTVLQNAIQAIENGAGVVSAETNVHHAASDAERDEILVVIRDTGRGMSDEQVAHLFDVAWSKQGSRTSMRLGLSAAYATMQRHNGKITVESELGKGTVVTFRFPARDED